MSFTPNTQLVVDAVKAEFGSKVSMGGWLCRRIAGTITWSQHSWTEERDDGPDYLGNAVDIFPDSMAIGDQVYAFIRSEPDLSEVTKTLLWRVKNHFDHLHDDTWPTGVATPPCKSGGLLVRHRDGRLANTFGRPLVPTPIPPPPDPVPIPPIMEEVVPPITKDSPQEAIRFVQLLINDVFYPTGQGIQTNGIYGEGFAGVVVKKLIHFTNDPDPEVTSGWLINAAEYKGLFREWIRKVAP